MKPSIHSRLSFVRIIQRAFVTGTLFILLLTSTLAAPKLGTRSSSIGTFNGWNFYIGWIGSFSESYAPEKEKYSWNVFFAPEAIYVALISAQAVYSGVDVNLGMKYFYGFLQAPNGGSTLSASYLTDDLWGVSFSIGYPEGTPPVGLMSQLSIAFEIEQGFFRRAHTHQLVPGIQWAAGFTAAYSLLPITLPFTVELDRDWIAPPAQPAPSLFWPIVISNGISDPARHPIDQIQDALRNVSTSDTLPATAVLMGSVLEPLMDKIATDSDLRSFISNPSANTRIRQAMTSTETWLVTSDTGTLSEALKPIKTYPETRETVRPVLCGTQLAFETGYLVGAKANPNNHTVYVDGVVTNYCVIGEKCTLEVPVAELLDVIPGHSAAEFEGASIGFDYPIEGGASIDQIGQVAWMRLTNGVARFTIAQSTSTPQLLGVRYDDPSDKPLNNGHDVELKRRLILFVDPSDRNANGIPDFWEQQYHLTDTNPNADPDGDGYTNYQEYVAGTDPTKAADALSLRLDTTKQELLLPFASDVRRYTIQANTNSISHSAGWRDVLQFMGSDTSESIDVTSVLSEAKAFFRVKVEKPH